MSDNGPVGEGSLVLRLASIATFAVTVTLFLFVSARAGVRWLGVITTLWAITQIIQRRLPYGWEGRKPSGYITGIPAVLLGILFAAIGVFMLMKPDLVLALTGWGDRV